MVISLPKRKLDSILKLLSVLLNEDKPVTPYYLQRKYDMRFDTLDRAIRVLLEVGFVNQEVEMGPPPRRFISLTEKGRKAAYHAREILKLAGEL